MTPRRVLLIVNPTAGNRTAVASCARFEQQLQSAGLICDRKVSTAPSEALYLARQFAPQFDVLVAVGGDGTAFEVANGILAAGANQAALSILPSGTGNDLAKVLGIGSAAETARALLEHRTRRIDVIEISCIRNGKAIQRHALLFAAVGIISDLSVKTTNLRKRLFGRRLAYRVSLLQALWSYSSPQMHVTCDGSTIENRFLLACASNADSAGGGIKLAPGALMDDGLLNVNLVEAMSRPRAFNQLRRLARGRHINHPKVRYTSAQILEVKSAPPIDVAADGELLGQTPARFCVRPKGLLVVA
jgi:YegS/Rv2252/BmrU family lipid kinase